MKAPPSKKQGARRDVDPVAAPKSRGRGRERLRCSGEPISIRRNDPKCEGEPLPIDFGPDYQPGDVFKHVFAGLPGFEDVEAPVRRKAEPGAATVSADSNVVAMAGVQGPAQKIPHLDTIQKSFGSHDISGIKAHVGGDAEVAAGALGAKAYAVGDAVAFKSQPDLHTAAHEAAHVVQQTGQVKFKGKKGAASDAHEKQADAAADAVVAGKSAEPVLDGDGVAAEPRCEGTDMPLTTSIMKGKLNAISNNLLFASKQTRILRHTVDLMLEVLAANDHARSQFKGSRLAIANAISERGEPSTKELVLNAAKTVATVASMFYGNTTGVALTVKRVGATITAVKSGDKALGAASGKDTSVEEALEYGLEQVQNAVGTLGSQLKELIALFALDQSLDITKELAEAATHVIEVNESLGKAAGCAAPNSYSPEFVAMIGSELSRVQNWAGQIKTVALDQVMLMEAAESVGVQKMKKGEKYRTLFDELKSRARDGDVAGITLVLEGKKTERYYLYCDGKAGDALKAQFPAYDRHLIAAPESEPAYRWKLKLRGAEGATLRMLESQGLPFEDRR